MLNAGALVPVVYKALVVLKTTIDAAVELDDLVRIQGSPQSFGCWFSLPCTETALVESFQPLFHGGFQDGCPSCASSLNRFALAGLVPHDFGFSCVANGQDGSQEECLFGLCVGDARFLFIEGELEMIVEKGFHQFLNLLCCGVTSAQADEPIIRISQVFHPAKCGIIDHLRRGSSDLFHDRSERFGFRCPLSYQSVFLPDESNMFRIVPFSGSF